MTESAGDGGGPATGVKPGALTDLLRQVAASPERREDEPPPLLPGSVVGRFEIVREVGRGGFGVVYEARDRELGRLVALKTVRAGAAVDEEGRVVREAEAIARLSHPNLITLHDVGRSDRGPYLVFEFLHGKTLQERLDDGPLQVQEAVHIAVEVARGLAHAHGEGVVHRDLKPSNVFVTNKGQVKILDFGLAHAFGRRRVSGGTPAYMAPEQWEDDPEDERTDVFALGVMLFRMLSGELPFPEGEGRWSAEPATAPRLDVPGQPGLAELVARMLDKAPKGRPRDGAAVLAALTPIEEALRARPADRSAPIRATRRKATLADLLAELKRRRVFRVMAGYGIFAFAALQVTEPVLHAYDLPGWLLTVVVTTLAAGFPLAIVLAWLFDLTARGVERTPSATGRGAASISRGQLAWLLAAAAITAALPGIGWYAWKQASERRYAAALPVAGPSIAVLPFTDVSPGKDQDYLADGIAEEILGALSRVGGLRVPGRASSFWFKGKNVEPAEIARKLRVAHLLEGSVRRSGSKLRITAEVVKASSGDRVWSETYERELSDVFAIQDEIARSVVRELAPMLLERNPPPPPAVTTDPEAYRHFLLGLSLFAQLTPEALQRALKELERSVALDPRFAPAQATLAAARSFAQRGARGEEFRKLGQSGREAAERAVALDPSSFLGYVSRAWYRMYQDLDWKGASEDVDRALAIAPANEWALNVQAMLLSGLGRTREAVEVERRAVDLSPLNAILTTNLAALLASDGQYAEAREWARRTLEFSPGNGVAFGVLGYVSLLTGNAQEALADFERSVEPVRSAGNVASLHALGRERESREALARFERDHADRPVSVAGVRAWRGDLDGAFAALDRAVEERDSRLWDFASHPLLRPIRGDPRFAVLLRRLNLPADGWGADLAPQSPSSPSIAVLPFADLSPRHDQEYFADGVTEEILSALSQVPGLRVPGRVSSFFFKGKNARLEEVGRELKVEHVLEGSVRRSGNRLRILAEVVRASDGERIWSQTFDRELTDVFAVQDEIAKAVVGALKVKLLDRQGPARADRRPVNPEAYGKYLLGRDYFRRGGVERNLRLGVEAYQRALAIDPGYATAWAGLAEAQFLHADFAATLSGRLEGMRRALSAAEKAIELAPGSPDGYLARAGIRRVATQDFAGADADIERALALRPGDRLAQRAHGAWLVRKGRAREGIAALRESAQLDPLDGGTWTELGLAHLVTGDTASARAALERALGLSPDEVMVPFLLGEVSLLEGQAAAALAAYEKVPDEFFRTVGAALARHALGQAEAAQQAIDALVAFDRQTHNGAYQIAQVHAWRGERDAAIEWLERAYQHHDGGLVLVKADPLLRPLRGDPRYSALVRKMNLPVD